MQQPAYEKKMSNVKVGMEKICSSVSVGKVCHLIGALHEISTYAKFQHHTKLLNTTSELLMKLRQLVAESLREIIKNNRDENYVHISIPTEMVVHANYLIKTNTERPCRPVKKRKPSKVINIRR